MTKQNRNYNEKFIKYQKFIIKHAAYKGMPMPSLQSKNIPWVAPATSSLGKAREEWWNKKKVELQNKNFLLALMGFSIQKVVTQAKINVNKPKKILNKGERLPKVSFEKSNKGQCHKYNA